MNLRDQLTTIQNQLVEEKSKSAVDKNMTLISQLELQEADLLHQIMVEEQNAASQLRIQEATEQAAYFLDNLIIEGMTMRELCAGEAEYQVLKISVQNKIITMAEESARLLSESQAEDAAKQADLKKQIEDLNGNIEFLNNTVSDITIENSRIQKEFNQIEKEKSQAILERNDFESKLKNATAEIERLNDQVDDLRKEIAVGARNAYKVTDVEQAQQLKALADQIKASRIHVYDVVPDNFINPKNYTAKRVDTGEEVNYNWTQAKNYVVVTDPEEVERFREQFANKEANADSALGNEEVNIVAPEDTFPEVPIARAPEVPDILPTNTVDQGQQDGNVSAEVTGAVTREEFEALSRRVIELEKVCNVNEEAA